MTYTERPSSDQFLDFFADLAAERALQKLTAQGLLADHAAMLDKWIGTREAADYLGLSVDEVHRLVAARRIPFQRDAPGHKCHFKRSELDEWRRNGGAPAWTEAA